MIWLPDVPGLTDDHAYRRWVNRAFGPASALSRRNKISLDQALTKIAYVLNDLEINPFAADESVIAAIALTIERNARDY